jgi:3-deoxy-D-manno-octulosonate 8-phosphate phosphatase (KDO 8-P phosphatase)
MSNSKIKLLILDVDGVLTDGKITYTESGEEIKSFNVKDGLGIKLLQKAGIEVAIISGRKSKVTEIRANELGIEKIFQGIADKKEIFNELINELKITKEETAFIGDDFNDVSLLKEVGYSATVLNSPNELKEIVDVVINAKGGEGAVRIFIENILKRNNQWKNIINTYLLL